MGVQTVSVEGRAAAVLLWVVALGWAAPAPWLMWWVAIRGRLPILPIEMKIGTKRFNWITTLTSFGSTQDALVQGVLIESFFPADAETRAHFEGA